MKVILTEETIRKALHESIDEMILEEELLQEYKPGNLFKKAWNGVKNAAAMYMDWRTRGQWNRKYNIQANGNGFAIGSYYLQKWLKTHYNRLYDIVYGEYYGNRLYFYTKLNGREQSFNHDWKNNAYTLYDNYNGYVYKIKVDYNNAPVILTIENSKGNEISKSSSITRNYKNNSYEVSFNNSQNNLTIYYNEDETTPELYIAKNCTPNSFIKSTQNILGDGNVRKAILNYLQSIQNINNSNIEKLKKDPNENINYNYMLNLFTISSFYNWYGKNNNGQQQQQNTNGQQQQQNANNQSTQGQKPVGRKDPNRNLDNGVPNLTGGGTFKNNT